MANNVGGSMFAECMKSLGYEGRLATVGYVDGVMRSELDIEALHSRRLKLFGVSNKMRSAASRWRGSSAISCPASRGES